MSLIQFLEKNEINYCPINLHYCEDKKKWIESKDVNTLTSGTKFIDDNTDTPLFWKCKKEEIRKRKEKDNLNEKSEEIYNTMKIK